MIVINLVIMIGRLTKDPEVRYSQGNNQTAIARYSIAVNRRFKKDGQPDADFFDCTAFGKQAEFAEKYLKKGVKIALQGELQNNNYTDKDGNHVHSQRIIVNTTEFTESKASSQQNQGNQQSASKPQTAPSTDNSFMDIPEGDFDKLPFN